MKRIFVMRNNGRQIQKKISLVLQTLLDAFDDSDLNDASDPKEESDDKDALDDIL